MLYFTSCELQLLVGLRTSWGKLYLREIARLLNEDESKCTVARDAIHVAWYREDSVNT